METHDQTRRRGGFRGIHKLMLSAVVGALAGSCAIAGAFLGAVAGALAGRASECGVLRGAALGAVTGAVLSFEMFEASRACWCLEQTGSRGPSAMADFIEQLLHGRFIDEQFSPTMLTAHHWQVNIAAGDYDEMNGVQDGLASRGLSGDLLHKLPHHEITKEIKTLQNIFCTICLQDIEIGETARNLPGCQHMFHLTCVDKWLIRHGSCPVCRQCV